MTTNSGPERPDPGFLASCGAEMDELKSKIIESRIAIGIAIRIAIRDAIDRRGPRNEGGDTYGT